MDYLSFVRSLSLEQRKDLTRKSNWYGSLNLLIHVTALMVTGVSIYARVPLWQLLLIIHGILLVFLFTLMHEATHNTAFASRRLNTLVTFCCGLILFLPPQWFKYFHFAHHRHTQDPKKDPELATPKPESRWQYITYISGVPLLLSLLKTITRNSVRGGDDEFVPQSRKELIRSEARTMIAIYLCLLLISWIVQSAELLILWLLPIVLGQPFLRLFLLAEHGNCALSENVFENTRTTFTLRLLRLFAWNMSYHAEHHAYPSVPFYKLGDVHRLMREHIVHTENGYLRFNVRYMKSVKLKSGETDSKVAQ